MANRDRFIVLVEEPEPYFVHGGQSVADVAQDVVAQVNQVLMLGLVLKLSNIQGYIFGIQFERYALVKMTKFS